MLVRVKESVAKKIEQAKEKYQIDSNAGIIEYLLTKDLNEQPQETKEEK